MTFDEIVDSLLLTADPNSDDFVKWMMSIQAVSPEAFQRIANLAEFIKDPRFSKYVSEAGTHWIVREVIGRIPMNENGHTDANLFFEACDLAIELEKTLAVREWQLNSEQGVYAE